MEVSNKSKKLCFLNTPLLPNLHTSNMYDIILTLNITQTENGPAFNVHTELSPAGSHSMMMTTEKSYIAADMLRRAYPANDFIKTLTRLITLYDKNHMHAGTQLQEKAIKQAVHDGILTDLTDTAVTNYLKAVHLYTDDSVRGADGQPHRYGHGWVYTGIPDDDMQTICDIISGNITQTITE